MIIECDQCNTKFRLDDSRVSPNGVKVRCTKCHNVFIVTPPPPPEEVVVEEVFGTGTPFGEKGPEASGSTASGQESFSPPDSEKEATEPESSAWGVFKDEDESGTDEDNEGTRAEDEEIDNGGQEAPDLSFGGPDFGSLTGPSEDAGGDADEETVEEKTEEDETPEGGAWFRAPSLKDDGFPEDGPAEGTVSGETPFDDEASDEDAGDDNLLSNEPAAPEESIEPPADEDFDVTTPAQEDENIAKPPFDEFDFGIDDQDETATEEEFAVDAVAPEEEVSEAPEVSEPEEALREAAEEPGEPLEEEPLEEEAEEETEAEEEKDEFTLTPPPEPPAKQPEIAAGEKVIPFSSGYGRNGKATQKAAGAAAPGASAAPPAKEENRFEDLFSRTIAEQAEAAEVEPEEREFDEAGFEPRESASSGEDFSQQQSAGSRAVIIAVLIFIFGAGAIYFSGIIDTVARTLTSTAPAEVVEIETIKGYIAANKNFGKFFVIEAKIKNTSDEPQPIEKITGVIYDDRGKSIATRSVSPGRMVGEEDLKNLSKSDLLDRFSDSSGGVIPPQGTVPVMVPFTEMPAGMAEYGLKIIRE